MYFLTGQLNYLEEIHIFTLPIYRRISMILVIQRLRNRRSLTISDHDLSNGFSIRARLSNVLRARQFLYTY